MIFARLASQFALGGEASRQQKWCEMVAAFSADVFSAAVVLKKIPSFLQPLVFHMLPFSRRIRRSHRQGAEMVAPLIERWSLGTATAEDRDTVAYWILEHAREDEKTPEEMAVRVNSMVLASVHTNGMTLTGALFQLCAHPDFVDVLRDEISEVERELGPMGAAGPETLQKQWLPRLEKMDSFIAEVLRYHQPVLCMCSLADQLYMIKYSHDTYPQLRRTDRPWRTLSSRTEPSSQRTRGSPSQPATS